MLQSIDVVIALIVILLMTSLLVTILVQILSSILSLRGKNLGNALALTLQDIHPGLGKDAHKLAERILSDPRISDSTWAPKLVSQVSGADQEHPWSWWSLKGLHLASAIRPEEIYDMLEKFAAELPAENADGIRARQILEVLKARDTGVVSEGMSALAALTSKLPAGQVPAEVAEAIQRAREESVRLGAKVTAAAKSAQARLEARFTVAEQRAQQWFQTHIRVLTVTCSLALAFGMQLDTVEIFKFVSTNTAARNALVASADQIVQKSGGIIEEGGTVLDSIFAAEQKAFAPAKLDPALAKAATTSGELRDSIRAALQKEGVQIDQKYDEAERAGIKAYYDGRRRQMADLTQGVAATGFDLLPAQLLQRWEGGYFASFPSHFAGMLITAALLSLGAPFWYNSLKELLGLRGAVAKSISNEKQKK